MLYRSAANGVYRALSTRGRYPVPFDARLLEILCCPLCREALKERPDATGLECVACRRIYPIVDGIPNLLVDDPDPAR